MGSRRLTAGYLNSFADAALIACLDVRRYCRVSILEAETGLKPGPSGPSPGGDRYGAG
jgi:hypothetical protein